MSALIRLLWRNHGAADERRSRGPAKRVTIDDVVGAAVRRADRDGLDAVSMRALAGDLGLGSMSVYTYVPGRDILLALMVDQVAADDAGLRRGRDPRSAVLEIGRVMFESHCRHPWVLDVTAWRDVLGPHRLARYERQLELIEPYPFTDIQRDGLLGAIGSIAAGSVRAMRDADDVARRSGLNDEQWWAQVGPVLAEVIPEGAFPLSGRVGQAAGEYYGAPGPPDGGFAFAIERLAAGADDLLAQGPVDT